jgi:hypothetical protein
MARILHILTRRDDSLAREIIELQKASQLDEVQVVDLTKANPDYNCLLEAIFASDSMESW